MNDKTMPAQGPVDANVRGRRGPFWDAVGAALVDVGGENKPCLIELWSQGVAYGRALEKAHAYRCAADQIDSGATTNDLRKITDGLGVGIDESRDAGQTGPCARAHETPANSDADCECCDSVLTPNVEHNRRKRPHRLRPY